MDKLKILDRLKSVIKIGEVLSDEPMKNHTTFKVGGPADIIVQPGSAEEVVLSLKVCSDERCPVTVIGNGSNLLVRDGGIRGAVIKIGDKMSDVRAEENKIIAGAGALMSKVANVALENSLSGFEFASGIPGTIGGGVTMNAGAYGGEMKDSISSVTCVSQDGTVKKYSREDMMFGYRNSLVQIEQLVVLEVELELESDDKVNIKAKIDAFKILLSCLYIYMFGYCCIFIIPLESTPYE